MWYVPGLPVLIAVSGENFANLVVFVGNHTKMTSCGNYNDTRIQWQRLKNHRIIDTVYNGRVVDSDYTSRFSVNNNYDLLINDTQLDDAGIYICTIIRRNSNWEPISLFSVSFRFHILNFKEFLLIYLFIYFMTFLTHLFIQYVVYAPLNYDYLLHGWNIVGLKFMGLNLGQANSHTYWWGISKQNKTKEFRIY